MWKVASVNLIQMIWEAIILGILQGIFEWLPISSRGNLVLLMVPLLGIDKSEALNLSMLLHIGTFLAHWFISDKTSSDFRKLYHIFALGNLKRERTE